MKCGKCGFENKDNSKFCTKCGEKLVSEKSNSPAQSSNNSKYVIGLLIVIIVILVAVIGFYAFGMNSGSTNDVTSDSSNVDQSDSSNGESESVQEESSSKTKSWELIGSYSGSGTGSKTVSVPAGKIMVKLSSFPIKNYADNHLHVSGTNGASGGVDWGPTSDVETRSDSFEYTSSSAETFTIDYYETVSWEVEFYRYQ